MDTIAILEQKMIDCIWYKDKYERRRLQQLGR